jgi:hypothetical protein
METLNQMVSSFSSFFSPKHEPDKPEVSISHSSTNLLNESAFTNKLQTCHPQSESKSESVSESLLPPPPPPPPPLPTFLIGIRTRDFMPPLRPSLDSSATSKLPNRPMSPKTLVPYGELPISPYIVLMTGLSLLKNAAPVDADSDSMLGDGCAGDDLGKDGLLWQDKELRELREEMARVKDALMKMKKGVLDLESPSHKL